MAFAIALALMLIVILSSSAARLGASSPSWVTWLTAALTVYGPAYVFVLSPRLVKDEEIRLRVLQWSGGLSSFLVAWASWFVFGISTWVLILGVMSTTLTLAALATRRRW